MRVKKSRILVMAAFLLLCGNSFAQTCSGMTVGQLTSLNGFVPFASSSLWNTDISASPVVGIFL